MTGRNCRLLLARGDTVRAREAVSTARALHFLGGRGALLAAIEVRVCEAEGDVPSATVALAEAMADPRFSHTEAGMLIGEILRRGLTPPPGGAAASTP